MSKIALLATGDELIHGDTLNTNSAEIAHYLYSHGFDIGEHLTCVDDITAIVHAITFCLQHNDTVIITGGLGPTSDDKTRFALAQYLNKELVFDEHSWTHIQSIMRNITQNISPSNRQQCLFPERAEIINNPNGTANGCYYQHHGKHIFMLPGPPAECIPIIRTQVIKKLSSSHRTKHKVLSWRLFGVGEGQVATELEALLHNMNVQTAYRWSHPYIDFKVIIPLNYSNEEQLTTLISNAVRNYIISHSHDLASEELSQAACSLLTSVLILDEATHGLLQSTILNPNNRQHLYFNATHAPQNSVKVTIEGLDEYWSNQFESKTTTMRISYQYQDHNESQEYELPFRSHRILSYALEFISAKLLVILRRYQLIA